MKFCILFKKLDFLKKKKKVHIINVAISNNIVVFFSCPKKGILDHHKFECLWYW